MRSVSCFFFFDVLSLGCCRRSSMNVTSELCTFRMTAFFVEDRCLYRRALSEYFETRMRLGGGSLPCHDEVTRNGRTTTDWHHRHSCHLCVRKAKKDGLKSRAHRSPSVRTRSSSCMRSCWKEDSYKRVGVCKQPCCWNPSPINRLMHFQNIAKTP